MAEITTPIMESNDFSKKIEAAFIKEMQDVKLYVEIMKKEDRENNREWASGFYYMAKDEYTHVVFLHEILEDIGYTMPETIKKNYEDFEKEYNDMFQ